MKRYLIFPTLLIGGLAVFLLAHAQGAPVAPSNLTATVVSGSEVRLTWRDNATDELGMLLYRSLAANLANATIIPLALNATSYSDTGLTAGITYYYQVYACNVAGCSASNIVSATPTGPAAPAASITGGGAPASAQGAPPAPSELTVVRRSSCALKVSWAPSAGADAYDAERNGIVEPSIATADEGGKRTFTDADGDALWAAEDATDRIDPGETYSYRVRAKNVAAGAASGWAGPVGEITNPLPPNPGAPRDVAETFGNGRIELSWLVNAPTSNLFSSYGGFEVWRAVSVDGGRSFSALEKLDRIPSSQKNNDRFYYYDIRDITPDRAYQYVLKTQEVGGEGCDATRPAHAVVSDPSPAVIVPTAPGGLAASFIEEGNSRRIVLTWTDRGRGAANEKKFEILRSTRGDFGAGSTASYEADADATRYEDTQIEQAGTQTYWYKVRACRDAYCSSYTDAASASTGIPAPYDLRATPSVRSGGGVVVALSWKVDMVLSGTEFRLERRLAGEGNWPWTLKVNAANCGSTPNACADASVEQGKTYEYRVSARRGGGTAYSNVATVDLNLAFLQVWAWAMADSPHGIGWIALSADTTGAGGTTPYGVSVDQRGELKGYAWSGIACDPSEGRPADATCGYGWLSFNKGDLDGREAKVDLNTKTVTGWARFIAADTAKGAWDGWVSLRGTTGDGKSYGLSYDAAAKTLDGFAWGGDVTGWAAFGKAIRGEQEGELEAPVLSPITEVTANSATLRWNNPVGYDKVGVFYTTDLTLPPDRFTPFGTPDAARAPQGSQSETVSDLTPATAYRFLVQGEKNARKVNSNVEPATTASTGYTLSCLASTASTITVGWRGSVPGAHVLNLYRSASETGSRMPLAPPPALATGSGSYADASGLSAGTTYWYFLRWGPTSDDWAMQPCSTISEASGAPSKLNVWALTQSSLLVNWKDNAVRPHYFVLERIKITPRSSAFYDPDGNGTAADTVSAGAIKLNWTNLTNGDALKGPFYHVLERSTSTTPFADRDEEGNPKQGVTPDPSFAAVKAGFTKDANYANKDTTYYTYTDSGLTEGTEYRYRAKACSLVKVNLDKRNRDSFTTVCSAYAPVANFPKQATAPSAPKDLLVAAKGVDFVTISWTDTSNGENGFTVFRDGQAVGGKGASSEIGKTVTFTDSGREAGRTYSYKVQAYKFDPNFPQSDTDPKARRIYSAEPSPVRATTNVTLAVARSPAAGGSVSGSVSCGTSCTGEFEVGDSISLTANPASGYTSKWTGDQCNNSFASTCAFTISGDTSVTANFAPSGGGTGGTVNVAATLNGNPFPTSFSFSILNGGTGAMLVGPGTKSVPWSQSDAPAGGYIFNFISGTPAGTTLSGISWSNSGGGSGSGSGGTLPEGGSLTFTVKFATTGGVAPFEKLFSSAERVWGAVRARVADALSVVRGAAEKTIASLANWAYSLSERALAGVQLESVPGIGQVSLDGYFAQFSKTLPMADYPSVYEDKSLETGTAYLYRVKACYNAGGCTPYSSEEAGKTLGEGSARGTKLGVGLCARNSLCEKRTLDVMEGVAKTYVPENQCDTNLDCRDVGTSRQFFEER